MGKHILVKNVENLTSRRSESWVMTVKKMPKYKNINCLCVNVCQEICDTFLVLVSAFGTNFHKFFSILAEPEKKLWKDRFLGHKSL